MNKIPHDKQHETPVRGVEVTFSSAAERETKGILAAVSFSYGSLKISDVLVRRNKCGLFVGWPHRHSGGGKKLFFVGFPAPEVRERIENIILSRFLEAQMKSNQTKKHKEQHETRAASAV